MAGHNDPRLLYSIPNISAFHVQDGQESPLTPSGPQPLSLLMVPTSSPFSDLSSSDPQSAAPEEDFYLHLHLPPELDLAIPATTQIYHQPPYSYLIPRWDLGPESGAFTRIQFPSIGRGPDQVAQEDVDTFETILAQCTAFHERSRHNAPPGYSDTKGTSDQPTTSYNPQDYGPSGSYAHGMTAPGGPGQHGHIVIVDEENGSVVGELSQGFNVVEDPNVTAGSKRMCHRIMEDDGHRIDGLIDPVEIHLPQDPNSNQIGISTASPEYLRDAMHPVYKDSKLVSNAAMASRLIVTTSSHISGMLQSGADNFTQKTAPTQKPLTFTPVAHDRARKINSLTQGAAGLSAKTVGQVSKYAQNLGATMSRRGRGKALDRDGRPVEGYRPGILNKSLIAFSTVADGIDQGARNLLNSSSVAASTVVEHRYGNEAGEIARQIGGGVKNVGLVYVDAAGVSRKAVVKSVAKGMVLGRVKGGGDLVVGGDASLLATAPQNPGTQNFGSSGASSGLGAATAAPGTTQVGFGNAAPPAYGAGVGEPIGGTARSGQDADVKRYS
ncbi:MAG: hypothetical protein M1823_004581 [Watsoniomyces obsoletus]|nr:MAG: hypothetical protein M1823_004581 [Watsoniomyces obsoletus]